MRKNNFFIYPIAFLSSFLFAIAIIFFSLFARELGIDSFGIGLLYSSFLLGILVSGPLWGALSDYIGKRTPIIVLSMMGMALSFLSMIFIRNWYLLVLGRFVLGSFFAANRPLISILTIETAPSRAEGKRVGFLNVARECGWAAGAVLAGVVAEIDLMLTFHVGFAAAGIGALCSFFLKEEAVKRSEQRRDSSSRFSISLIPKTLVFLYAATVSRTTAFRGIQAFLPVYYSHLHIRRSMMGLIFGVEGIMEACLSPFMGRLCDRSPSGPKVLLITGLLCGVMALFLYSIFRTPVQFVIMQVLVAFSWASFVIGATTLTAKMVPREARGKAMGLFESSVYSGGVIGPAIAPFFMGEGAFERMFLLFMIFPLFSAFIILTQFRSRQ